MSRNRPMRQIRGRKIIGYSTLSLDAVGLRLGESGRATHFYRRVFFLLPLDVSEFAKFETVLALWQEMNRVQRDDDWRRQRYHRKGIFWGTVTHPDTEKTPKNGVFFIK